MIAIPGIDRATSLPAVPNDSHIDYLFTWHAQLRFPHDAVGVTPEGVHIGFSIVGGNVSGPDIHGVVRAIGTDWLSVRPDGSGELDLRIAIETGDGAVIHTPHRQAIDWGPAGYRRALQGTLLHDDLPFHVTPRFQATDARYGWLSSLACIGLGHVSPARGDARCAFYAIH